MQPLPGGIGCSLLLGDWLPEVNSLPFKRSALLGSEFTPLLLPLFGGPAYCWRQWGLAAAWRLRLRVRPMSRRRSLTAHCLPQAFAQRALEQGHEGHDGQGRKGHSHGRKAPMGGLDHLHKKFFSDLNLRENLVLYVQAGRGF